MRKHLANIGTSLLALLKTPIFLACVIVAGVWGLALFAFNSTLNYKSEYKREQDIRAKLQKELDSLRQVNSSLELQSQMNYKEYVRLQKEIETIRKEYEKRRIFYNLPDIGTLYERPN